MRIKSLDNVRALCMIWIVGIWHLSEYCGRSISNIYAQNVTYGVLGVFTLISGLMMGRYKNRILSLTDAMEFYKKRLLRIYPLFAISCTSLFVLYLLRNIQFVSSVSQYLLSMIGLSIVFSPAPQTVWYVSMLLLFYFLTPVFLYNTKGNKLSIIIRFAVVYGVFLLLSVMKIASVDERLFMLFPVYCIGLMMNTETISKKCTNRLRLWVGIIAFLGMSAVQTQLGEMAAGIKIVYTIGVIVFFSMFVMEIGTIIPGRLEALLGKISYASMCAYLFHRQIYGALIMIFREFSIVGAFVAFSCVIVTCYFAQRVYDCMIEKVLKNV